MSQSAKTPQAAQRATVRSLVERPSAQVLIVGGGINGLGTLRDLALQGIDVALVERNDYASGASAASSHMIHGGIRYLENGELRLVRESVQERNGLIRIAPHYVKPLQTTMPIFSTFSGILSAPLRLLTHKQRSTKERGAALIQIGMTIYDSFSRDGGTVPRHVFRRRAAALADMPALNPGIKYTGTYYDASVHEPERLALDVLQDGLATGNARSANYVEAVGVQDDGVLLRDRETGESFVFHADVIVNASGPWTDLTNSALGNETRFMGGTKGSHIVVDNPELVAATKGREIFFENSDGRIVLIYPLKGRVLIGTTDTNADPRDHIVATDDEIQYFFDLVKHVYPQIEVTRDQIVYSYAGIRPLPRHEDTAPGFVSRDYRIVDTEIPGLADKHVLSLVGGKWTTFRALSEHLANDVLQLVGSTRTSSTEGLAIGGGKNYPKDDETRQGWISAHTDGLPRDMMERLFDRYGTRAAEVADALADVEVQPLPSDHSYTRGEIAYFAQYEHAVHLRDVVLRRTNAAFVGGVTERLLVDMAEAMGTALSWDEQTRATEVRDTIDTLAHDHGVTVGGLVPTA